MRITGRSDRGERLESIDVVGAVKAGGDVSGATATITGAGTFGTIVLGSASKGSHAGIGVAWGTAGTPALVGQQNYAKTTIDGTVYRIPLFADA